MLKISIRATAAAFVEHRENFRTGARKDKPGVLDLPARGEEHVDSRRVDGRAAVKVKEKEAKR